MQEALMRKNSNVLMPEAFGADHGFPVFDDLFLDNQISNATTNQNSLFCQFDEEIGAPFLPKNNYLTQLSKYQDDIYNFRKTEAREFPQIEVEALDLYPNKDEG